MSGIKFLADTNVIIKHLEGEMQVERVLDGALIFISAITYAELLSGSLTTAEAAVLNEYLSEVHIIHTNQAICQTAAVIRNSCRVKLPDALIAATSLFLDIPLLTFDSDFERINDLKIVKLVQ